MERNVTLALDINKFSKINKELQRIKLIAAGSSAICFGMALSGLTTRRIGVTVLYGVLSVDLLRVSYNCYLKNYLTLAMNKLGLDGNIKNACDTFFQMIQSAVGVTSSQEDPLHILKNEVSYELLSMNTIARFIYNTVSLF